MNRLRQILRGDFAIWIVLFLLAIFSILSVYSASGMLAYKEQGGNTSYYLIKHFLFIVLSFVIVYGVHLFPFRHWRVLARLLFWVSIGFLILAYAMGMNLNSAARWVRLPFGFSFQPSDFAKVTLLMYLASLLSRKHKKESLKNFKMAVKRLLLPILLVCGLIFPANFSTAFLLFGASLVLLFIAQVPSRYLLGFVGISLVVASLFILVMIAIPGLGRVETWKARIENFRSGESEDNFQADHSRIAIASGGIIPQGPGKSVQRNILPHPYSDFIFAIIVEEWGLIIGGIMLPFLYVILFSRAISVVRKTKSSFAAYLVSGFTVLYVFQAFSNMLVAVNLIPVTGQTLPFVSMGGSSILIFGFAMGIILSVSRTVDEDAIKQELSSEPLKSIEDEK